MQTRENKTSKHHNTRFHSTLSVLGAQKTAKKTKETVTKTLIGKKKKKRNGLQQTQQQQ
jgi:hypothetical protein